ncbi:hypothetical protein [Halobacterium zhouii]|uniref:hypothetical protein n=1 Tax=Halobacterium zhouii TaxID=2902624 RepID=UPI001E4D6DF6|nr:hypothetical protein [Halobacterium zhouii]
MGDKVQINLRVDDAQKEVWEAYIEEEGRFSSLSELIRASVEVEISDEQTSNGGASPGLANDLQTVKQDLERVRKDVQWLREQEQDAVDISELAQEVFDALEPLPSPASPVDVPAGIEMDKQEYRRKRAAESLILPTDSEEAEESGENPQTAKAIGERVNATPEQVRDAIEHLEDQFLPVVSVEVDGQTHYFTEN